MSIFNINSGKVFSRYKPRGSTPRNPNNISMGKVIPPFTNTIKNTPSSYSDPDSPVLNLATDRVTYQKQILSHFETISGVVTSLNENRDYNRRNVLITQDSLAIRQDKFDLYTGKFDSGYPETFNYDFCPQNLSSVYNLGSYPKARNYDNIGYPYNVDSYTINAELGRDPFECGCSLDNFSAYSANDGVWVNSYLYIPYNGDFYIPRFIKITLENTDCVNGDGCYIIDMSKNKLERIVQKPPSVSFKYQSVELKREPGRDYLDILFATNDKPGVFLSAQIKIILNPDNNYRLQNNIQVNNITLTDGYIELIGSCSSLTPKPDSRLYGCFPSGVNSLGLTVYQCRKVEPDDDLTNVEVFLNDSACGSGCYIPPDLYACFPSGTNDYGQAIYQCRKATLDDDLTDIETFTNDPNCGAGCSTPPELACRIYGASPGGTNKVGLFDQLSDATLANISVGDTPNQMVYDSEYDRLYVTNFYGNSVSVIDTVSNTVINNLTQPNMYNPLGVDIDTVTNKIYISTQGNPGMFIYDRVTNSLITSIPSPGAFNLACDVRVNSALNKAYVANRFGNNITVIDTTTDTVLNLLTINPSNAACQPFNIDFHTSTNIVYLVTRVTNEMHTISADGSAVLNSLTFPINTFPDIMDIKINSFNNKAYVSSQSSSGGIYVVDLDSNSIDTLVSLPGAASLALSSDGLRLFVGFGGGPNISVMSTATNTIVDTITTPYSIPYMVFKECVIA